MADHPFGAKSSHEKNTSDYGKTMFLHGVSTASWAVWQFFFFALVSALSAFGAEKIDNRNFAIDICYPTLNEMRLAQVRASKYWAKHSARFGSNPVISR